MVEEKELFEAVYELNNNLRKKEGDRSPVFGYVEKHEKSLCISWITSWECWPRSDARPIGPLLEAEVNTECLCLLPILQDTVQIECERMEKLRSQWRRDTAQTVETKAIETHLAESKSGEVLFVMYPKRENFLFNIAWLLTNELDDFATKTLAFQHEFLHKFSRGKSSPRRGGACISAILAQLSNHPEATHRGEN